MESDSFTKVLENVDWVYYERNVLDAFWTAAYKFARMTRLGECAFEPVFQVGIWTDVCHSYTAINFETKQHAELVKQREEDRFSKRGKTRASAGFQDFPYNTSPADFLYTQFHTMSHTELRPLEDLVRRDLDNRKLAEGLVERSLLRVRDEAVSVPWRYLPREELVWFGINSPRDWYDHVIEVPQAHSRNEG